MRTRFLTGFIPLTLSSNRAFFQSHALSGKCFLFKMMNDPTRVSYIGIITGFQPVERGSTPLTRSKSILGVELLYLPPTPNEERRVVFLPPL